jgi:hypothetical protein
MKTLNLFFLLTALALVFSSCNKDNEGNARLIIKLTDAPGDYEEVNIDIQDIVVQGSNTKGWVSLDHVEKGIYNLLELTNGVEAILGDNELPSGRVSQLRLILGENNTVVIDGQTHSLKTPSAQQSGLKLNIQTDLKAGVTYNILLDFDAGRSIVRAKSDGYILKPVIRTIMEPNSGAIRGTVKPIEANPAIFVLADKDTIAGTYPDEKGDFLFKGIQAGTYNVAFAPATGYAEKVINAVNVSTGEVRSLGVVDIEVKE